MPFTISHAAAALPLNRRGLILSALVVGSMAPDFLYFLRPPIHTDFGHSLPGLLLFDLPFGWLVVWAFHAFLKNPLYALLPLGHQRRLAPYLRRFAFGGVNRAALITLSLLVGSLSHLAWDSFTHKEGLMVQMIPALRAPLFDLGSYSIMVYSALQYGCTVLGLVVLAWAYIRWYRAAPQHTLHHRVQLESGVRWRVVGFMLLAAGLLGVTLGMISFSPVDSLHHFRLLVSSVVVNTISILAFEVLLYGVVWHLI